MRTFDLGNRRLLIPAALIALLVIGGTLFASTGKGVRIPAEFQHWYLVNSMLVSKEPNKTGLITGNHLIYVNRLGFARLKRGGSTPYPEGTIFVDDDREFSLDDAVYHQGARKFVTVMIKDSKQYAATGGWGFQAWPGGDPAKPIVTDAPKQCFACHTPNKANDYVFSTYLH
jgi:hypothetical protein